MEFHKYTVSKKGFFRKSFEIHEENNLLYTVKCPGWLSYKFFIFNNSLGVEKLAIERIVNLFNWEFEFHLTDGLKGKMTKKTFSDSYTLVSKMFTYELKGNLWGNEYTVYLGEDDIAKVSRNLWTNKDQYGIAIMEGNHNLAILGMIVSLEIIKMTGQNG